MHDRKDDVRDVGLEALGNKASPRERCPRVAAPVPRTGQCRHGWTQVEKTAREGTPEPKNDKSTVNCRQTRNNHHSKQPGMGPQNPRTKRADPQRVEKSNHCGKERTYSW